MSEGHRARREPENCVVHYTDRKTEAQSKGLALTKGRREMAARNKWGPPIRLNLHAAVTLDLRATSFLVPKKE